MLSKSYTLVFKVFYTKLLRYDIKYKTVNNVCKDSNAKFNCLFIITHIESAAVAVVLN